MDVQSQLMNEMRQKAGNLKHVNISESSKNKTKDTSSYIQNILHTFFLKKRKEKRSNTAFEYVQTLHTMVVHILT
jgi:hypothetical protein